MRIRGFLAAFWGLAGVFILLGYAIVRLSVVAAAAFTADLQWYHWLTTIGMVVLLGYAEGYRGFQKSFSPRVAARLRYLYRNPHPWLYTLFSPFFCIGYFAIQRRRQIVICSLTLGIILLVQLVRLLAQPWKGIVDAGVVVGLTWGLLSVLVFSVQALCSDDFTYSAALPEAEPRSSLEVPHR